MKIDIYHKDENKLEEKILDETNSENFWENKYRELLASKEFLNEMLRDEFMKLSEEVKELETSRNSWREGYGRLEKRIDELESQLPDNISWPRFSDSGELVQLGQSIKITLPSGDPFDIKVDGILFNDSDVNGIMFIRCSDIYYSPIEINQPDPDTYDTIIRDAIQYGLDSTCSSSEPMKLSDTAYSEEIINQFVKRICDIKDSDAAD